MRRDEIESDDTKPCIRCGKYGGKAWPIQWLCGDFYCHKCLGVLAANTDYKNAKDKAFKEALADMATMAMTVEEASKALSRSAGDHGVLADIHPELLTLTARQVKLGKAMKILIKKWRKEAGKETVIDRLENWLDSLFRP